ncbi:inositol monophosphatase family protein [Ralstonia sp. VS2407]
MHDSDLEAVGEFAQSLADLARRIAERYFRTSLRVSVKSDRSPVTQADQEIEQEIRQAISQRYPQHAFFGEESGGIMQDAATWVVDPVDGTKSFICGVPLFGSLIAFLIDRRPILGVLEMPALKERWVGHSGRTLFNGRQVRVSDCKLLMEARLFATSPDMFAGPFADAFADVSSRVAMRRFGTDCYAYGLLASGHCDLVIEAGLKPYDVMALIPVIENAGGVVTDWSGRAIDTEFSGHIIAAASRELHEEALRCLASHASW